MMENRQTLNTSELDGFEKRSLPSPGFQVEIVLVDYDGKISGRSINETTSMEAGGKIGNGTTSGTEHAKSSNPDKASKDQDKDDVFSDSESDENESSRRNRAQEISSAEPVTTTPEEMAAITHGTAQVSFKNSGPTETTATNRNQEASCLAASNIDSMGESGIKAIAADASVFSFGDEDDSDSE